MLIQLLTYFCKYTCQIWKIQVDTKDNFIFQSGQDLITSFLVSAFVSGSHLSFHFMPSDVHIAHHQKEWVQGHDVMEEHAELDVLEMEFLVTVGLSPLCKIDSTQCITHAALESVIAKITRHSLLIVSAFVQSLRWQSFHHTSFSNSPHSDEQKVNGDILFDENVCQPVASNFTGEQHDQWARLPSVL